MTSGSAIQTAIWHFIPEVIVLNPSELSVRLVRPSEEQRFQRLMQEHHYLGALPKISETLWYVASFADQWVALLSFSAPALKCSARDRWIGWTHRHQYDRLKLLTNNSRFLILRDWHLPNLASRILSLCQKRLPTDWQTAFGHPLVLIRVDPLYLDRALQRWNQAYGQEDESLAIEGKTMCNAIDDQGHQTHIMSAVGHQTKACYTQKK
jgi:hypothetical protein